MAMEFLRSLPTIDCIAVKRDAQSKIYEEIKNMTSMQEIEYFRRAIASSRLKDWWEQAGSSAPANFQQAS